MPWHNIQVLHPNRKCQLGVQRLLQPDFRPAAGAIKRGMCLGGRGDGSAALWLSSCSTV